MIPPQQCYPIPIFADRLGPPAPPAETGLRAHPEPRRPTMVGPGPLAGHGLRFIPVERTSALSSRQRQRYGSP